MELKKFKDMVQENVLASMLDFMGEEEAGFSREDVEACGALLNGYLDALAAMENVSDEAIMAQVQKTVLALNDLNEATDYCLIETGEREAIWEVIQLAAIARGLKNASEDITEEWRDW